MLWINKQNFFTISGLMFEARQWTWGHGFESSFRRYLLAQTFPQNTPLFKGFHSDQANPAHPVTQVERSHKPLQVQSSHYCSQKRHCWINQTWSIIQDTSSSIHKCKVNGWLSCFPFLPMHSCYSSSTSLYTMAGDSKFYPNIMKDFCLFIQQKADSNE